jgi:formiminotetrahydrofolate cyclodeaminase
LTGKPASSIDLTVADYAFQVSTATPTPGGGSVAGVTGALAAGLAGMVCALTLKGEVPESRRTLLEPAELSAGGLRLQLLGLAVEDEIAYQGYRIAAALPKATTEEKTARTNALQAALAEAAEAPLAIARACFDLLAILPVVAQHGTRHALSDASASALLAEAALRAALLNVHVNAAMIKDAELAARFRNEASRLESDAGTFRAQILETINSR